MGIREETHLIRLKSWKNIIEDRLESGLTIKEYCQEHDISRDAYMYWLRQLRAAELMNKENMFTELVVSDIPEPVAVIPVQSPITINVGKASITVQDKESLRTVVEVLLHAQ